MPIGYPAKVIGKRYGRLVVVKEVENDKSGNRRYLCKCDCGKELPILGCNLYYGRTVSCGCWNNTKCFKSEGTSNYNRILRMYKFNAKNTKKEWALSDSEFRELIQSVCYYCGSPPSTIQNDRKSNGGYVYNGIDRVDNDIGYIESNCVACCATCNFMKGRYSQEEFMAQAEKIAVHWASR